MNSSGWAAMAALLAAACGSASAKQTPVSPTVQQAVAESGSENLPAVHKRGQDKLIVAVGPAGGTLELDNGARLVIPEGALPEPTEITLAAGARTTAFANHDYERAVGPTLEVALHTELGSPLELSIPLGNLPEGFTEKDLALGVEVAASAQRYESQAVQTRWDYVDATARTGRAVASLTTPPEFRVQFLVSKSD